LPVAVARSFSAVFIIGIGFMNGTVFSSVPC
jgi:hypothetical protein